MTSPKATSIAHRCYPLLFLLLGLVWLWFILEIFNHYQLVTFPDTESYQRVAHHPIFSKAFLAGARPPSWPLFFKLLNYNLLAMAFMQKLLFVVSALAFALSLAHSFRHRVTRVLAFCVILLLAAAEEIGFWPRVLLSESLWISFFFLILALVLCCLNPRFSPTQRKYLLGVCLLLLLPWAFLRDTNGYFLLMLGLGMLPLALVFKQHLKQLLLLCLLPVLIGSVQIKTSGMAYRWMFPLVNVLSQRFLTDPVRTEYLIASGMPMNEKVAAFRGNWASAGKLRDFGDWVFRSKTVYQGWLLRHLPEACGEAASHWREVLDQSVLSYSKAQLHPGQARFTRLVAPRGMRLAVFFGLAAVALLFVAAGVVRGNLHVSAPAWVAFFLLALSLPMLFLVYHGDAMEVARHGLPVRIQALVGGWLAILAGVDLLLCYLKGYLAGRAPN